MPSRMNVYVPFEGGSQFLSGVPFTVICLGLGIAPETRYFSSELNAGSEVCQPQLLATSSARTSSVSAGMTWFRASAPVIPRPWEKDAKKGSMCFGLTSCFRCWRAYQCFLLVIVSSFR